jgi:hypothetical protein
MLCSHLLIWYLIVVIRHCSICHFVIFCPAYETFTTFTNKIWREPIIRLLKRIKTLSLLENCLWIVLTLLKVRQSRNEFFKPMFSPKNEQTNSILLLRDLFSFVFWRKLKTPKRHFEINWPLDNKWTWPCSLVCNAYHVNNLVINYINVHFWAPKFSAPLIYRPLIKYC